MANEMVPVALRHTHPQSGRCPSCLESLSNAQRAVIAHVDPNPAYHGRLIHPIHRKCLLNGYRIGRIERCFCGALLDIEQFLSSSNPQLRQRVDQLILRAEQAALPDVRERRMIPEIGSSVLYGVMPSVVTLFLAHQIQANAAMQQNQTNVQGIEPQSLDLTAAISGIFVFALAVNSFLSDPNRRENQKRDFTYGLSVLTAAMIDGSNIENKMTVAAIPIIYLLGAKFAPIGLVRDMFREVMNGTKNALISYKEDIFCGACTGLAIRLPFSNETSGDPRFLTACSVVAVLFSMSLGKGYVRAT